MQDIEYLKNERRKLDYELVEERSVNVMENVTNAENVMHSPSDRDLFIAKERKRVFHRRHL